MAKTEQSLLEDARGCHLQPPAAVSTVVELGPGSGEKLITLMAAGPERDVTIHLVDVSRAALDTAATALAAQSTLPVVAHQATYEEGLSAIGRSAGAAGQTLVVFLGSNIGNFDPPGTDALLRSIRAAAGPRRRPAPRDGSGEARTRTAAGL